MPVTLIPSASLVLWCIILLFLLVSAILIADEIACAYLDLWLQVEAAYRFAFDRHLARWHIRAVHTRRLL